MQIYARTSTRKVQVQASVAKCHESKCAHALQLLSRICFLHAERLELKPMIILLHVDDRTNLCTGQTGCECKYSQSAEPVWWLQLALDAFEHHLLESMRA